MLLVYAIGPISGCQVNPAVTVALLLDKRVSSAEAGGYIAAQLAGAAVAGGLLKLLTLDGFGSVTDQTWRLATSGWADGVAVGGAFILEAVLAFLLVFVVLQVTTGEGAAAHPGFQGLAIGVTLAVIHLVGIPVSGASVNPARSFGPAMFHGEAFGSLWLYLVAPLAGAVCAVGIHRLLRPLRATDEAPTAAEVATLRSSVGTARTPVV